MNSFNVYGQTEQKVGGNTPIWLGTVKPIPVGATVDSPDADTLYPAGSVGFYDAAGTFAILEPSDSEMANAYLYNDVKTGKLDVNGEVHATCAVVMHHPEGLLIERVYPEITEEQIATLQAKIPGVLLVRG